MTASTTMDPSTMDVSDGERLRELSMRGFMMECYKLFLNVRSLLKIFDGWVGVPGG